MAGEWHWDETLYRGSAEYYGVGRRPYPPAVAETIARTCGLDSRQRVLDVGCGPGSLTLLLAPLVSLAIGVDADPDMVAAAAAAADRAGITNVRWRCIRAEDLPAGLGRFGLVTFAQSIHWLDRPRVAPAVRDMLELGGACVHVHATTHRGDGSDDPLERPRPPYDEIDTLVRTYLGPAQRAGRGMRPTMPAAAIDADMRAAGFTGPQRVELDTAEVVTRTADEVVAATFSLSGSTPNLFGAGMGRFEADLRALLRDAAPEGRFSERTRDIVFDVWRP